MSEEMGLVKYDAMCTAIAACYEVDEVKLMRDQAIAIEAYAKQAMNTDAERKATEIRIRAERKCGQLLSEKEKSGGGQPQKNSVHAEPRTSEYSEAKTQSGISDTQAKRWQKLAGVDDESFEDALTGNDRPSTTGIIKKANGEVTPMHSHALWLWGRMRDFEKDGIAKHGVEFLLNEMTDTMQADIRRIAAPMAEFLSELGEYDGTE
jgi:hypothetical protein